MAETLTATRTRLPTDCDLSLSSLMWAWNLLDRPTLIPEVLSDRLVLRVHPYAKQYAQLMASWAFGPQWSESVVVELLLFGTNEDTWELAHGERAVWSSGA